MPRSGHHAQQLLLQDELALLVLFRALKCLVVFPPNHLFTLSACDVSHNVSAGGHVAVAWLGSLSVYDAVEEEGFAVLATEVLREKALALACEQRNSITTYTANDLVMVGKVSLAVLAAIDAIGVEIDVVGEAHRGE